MNAYNNGRGGVERDIKKANQYYELAAIGGDTRARHNLGSYEYMKGNSDRALKHWMISAGGGEKESLGAIQDGNGNKGRLYPSFTIVSSIFR